MSNNKEIQQPLISIITVTFNAAKNIRQCIESIESQPYSRIEHIIIDGASTDGTVNILKELNDRIAYWVSEPDNGIFHAMNKGLSHAKGDWIYFLGSDDTLYPEFSEMASLLTNADTIYYGQCSWGDIILGGKFSPYRLTKDCICHHSVLYPRSVFDKYSYSEKYPTGGDHLLNIQCWSDRSFKKKYYPLVIANFAQHGASQNTADPLFDHDFPAIIRKHCSLLVYLRYQWKTFKSRK